MAQARCSQTRSADLHGWNCSITLIILSPSCLKAFFIPPYSFKCSPCRHSCIVFSFENSIFALVLPSYHKKTLLILQLPYFMNELTLADLDMGTCLPQVLHTSKPALDRRGTRSVLH